MSWLVLGLIVWVLAHVLKRAAPGVRMRLDAALGAGPARGVIAAVLVVALVLMVVGFRRAGFVPVYDPPAWGVHLNNLMMLAAVGLLGAGHSKGRARAWLRNPMLTAVVVWALAHLLVNGDRASLVLFGGMALWAVAEMVLINRSEPAWVRPAPGTVAGDVRWIVITLIVFALMVAVHTWLGYPPFPH